MGLNNYRYFVSFLFWTFLGTMYLSLLCVPSVYGGSKISVDRFAHRGIADVLPSGIGLRGALGGGSEEDLNANGGVERAVYSLGSGHVGGEKTNSVKVNKIEREDKHGLDALVEAAEMLRLLLFSRPEDRDRGVNRAPRRAKRAEEKPEKQENMENGHGRRTAEIPPPGTEVQVPVPADSSGMNHHHLRGSHSGRSHSNGFPVVHDVSLFDVLLRPGVFNRLVALFPVDLIAVTAIFILTLSIHIAVAVLFFFHAYLVKHNKTTLEFNCGGRNHFDRGSARANFEEVFGPYPVWMALLPSRRGLHNSEDYCQATGHFSRSRPRVDTGYGNLLDV